MKHHHKITGLAQRQSLFDSQPTDVQAAGTRPGSLKYGDQHPRRVGRTLAHRKNRRHRSNP